MVGSREALDSGAVKTMPMIGLVFFASESSEFSVGEGF